MTGGGTAGHVYPAMAVAARFAAEHDDVIFVGTTDGPEARLVPEAGIPFVGLAARGYDRSRPWTLVTSSVVIGISVVRAIRMLRRLRPQVVIGFGGYVSIPVGIAARFLLIPLVLHEQNSVPGMANATLSRWADAVGVTYPESALVFAHPDRTQVSGNPVREAVLSATRDSGRTRFGLPDDAVVLLVFGGSRGARHLNTAVVAIRDRILSVPDVHVIHVAGHAEYGDVLKVLELADGSGGRAAGTSRERWHLFEYLEEMGLALAAADLVVARAGATSIAEITALGRPAVLVPYPYATDDHQTKNARACAENGAAVLIADAELDGERFGDAVVGLLADPGRRATMAAASRALGMPDAAERVMSLARAAARRKTGAE